MKILLEKGDSEEQIKMAEALLANKLVSAIETVTYKCQKVYKSDDEVAKAVIDVAGSFGVCTQWAAVYRILVDFCGWDSDVAKFTKQMNTLLKEVRMSHCCTYQSIQKPLAQNSILRKNFQEWKKYRVPQGDRVFPRQMFIAENLLKRLSISA
ncbi:hypothetical protein [Prevotella sp. E13-27]|uniref:hypothetical protein n=1 Tax=Prevotella sp. E13-27 TaxID=2938122 RepID=UPI00200AD2AF|nr:hypothetical protein [Prevotella sp. E13-27]MCK8622822.1 hypothetical protein [Prevotella sp. E13-27]